MPKMALIALILLPFVAWDVAVYIMRARGDRSPSRRGEILRHFSESDMAVGRDHVARHARLFPFRRVLFYLFFGILLFGGLGARLESSLLALTGGRFYLALSIFVFILLLTRTLLDMPVSAYSTFVIERDLGLSTITPGLWFLDLFKGLVLGTIIALVVSLPMFALIRAFPTAWPLPVSAFLIAFAAIAVWISPWLIDPLFNRFTKVADETLAGRIRDISGKAGVSVKHVYEMDASRRERYLNAYFAGLGSSRRVVLYDTLLKEGSPREVISVVAHELGHWKRNHIVKGFVLQALGTIVALWGAWALIHSASVRGVLGLPSPSSMVLAAAFPFLAALAGTLVAPVESAVSRRFEVEADTESLDLSNDPEAFIEVEKKLVRNAKGDLLQHPCLHRVYGSHPLPEERIRMAERRLASGP